MIKCLNCQGTIQQKRRTKKFCSPKCRVYWNRMNSSTGTIYLHNGVDNITRIDLTTKSDIAPQPKVTMGSEYKEKVFSFCKHDAVRGMCKKGCK